MTLSEMSDAIRDAKSQLANADLVATQLARLLEGRLRKVDSGSVLAAFKRELRNYNIQTHRWKE